MKVAKAIILGVLVDVIDLVVLRIAARHRGVLQQNVTTHLLSVGISPAVPALVVKVAKPVL